MASLPPPSSQELMTLGMFVFGMATIPFQSFARTRDWNHATAKRIGARDAAQYIGPGPDTISIGGLIVPEIGGSFSSLETLAEMAEAGEHYPLINGFGVVLGQYRILRLDEDNLNILAGGIPRQVDFLIELERGDDQRDQLGEIPPAVTA